MIEQLDKKFIQYLTRKGLVTQETLGTLIPFVTKKRQKKNYQEILSEYLNHLSSAGNKLNSVSKEMKSQFFMDMNDMVLNKNDELKYLILMREEYFKYKLKIYFFRKWKSKALYNHDLLDEDDPFQNNDIENYQNFKNMNFMVQGGTINSKHSLNNSLKRSGNENFKSRIGNNPNLLIFDDEEKNNNKKEEIKLEDSIKVLDLHKNINDALSNTNDVFSKFNTINSKDENNNNNNDETNNDNKNDQFNNILNSLQKLKINAINGEFNGEDNKNNDINDIENKKDLLSSKNNKLSGKRYNNKGEKEFKNNEENNEIKKSKDKNNKNFDLKKLYKYKQKYNYEEDEEKYLNSKYISTKYKDYLHSGNKLFNAKNSKSKEKNKLNDLYKKIQKNLEQDEDLLKRLELKREKSNQKIKGDKSRSKSKNRMDKNYKKANKNNYEIQKKIFMDYDNTKNFEENLIRNGFFSGGNKKNENIENEENNEEDLYPEKIKEIISKYQNNDVNNHNHNHKEENDYENYDYIKKVKAKDLEQYNNYANNFFQNNKNIKSKRDENDYDEDYDEIFHPKNIKRNNNDDNQLNQSDYSNSVYNILNNLDNYDNLLTDINEPKFNKIIKNRITTRNPKKEKKEKKSFLDNDFFENSRINNTSYILAPMKGVPITNISFRARMKYFSDKKQKNLEKMIKAKKDEEKQLYTFQPKTGENRLNVIKYDNYVNKININNKKRMPDYNRINNLYLDYKDRKNKLDELTKEYYKKAGISFTPLINDKNKEIKEFKNKIGQIPYLDRIDIYNANKQNNNKENSSFAPFDIY